MQVFANFATEERSTALQERFTKLTKKMTTIGNNLKKVREASRFTQEQISRHLGITRSAYANYEADERKAPINVLEGVAELTGCHLSTFFETDPEQVNIDLITAFRIDNLFDNDLRQVSKFKTIARNYLKMQSLK